MKKLTLSLIAALALAGCAGPSPVTPTEAAASRLYSFTTQVSFDAQALRRIMAPGVNPDNLTQLTGAMVNHIDVYLAANVQSLAGKTAADLAADTTTWSKATINQVSYDAINKVATGASVTFANLAYGKSYTIVAVAKGNDPNGATTNFSDVLNDANLYLSAAELRVPAPVGGTYQQNLTPTQFPVLFPFTAGGVADTTTVTALPAKLKDRTYNGHADNVSVKVQDGLIKQAEGAPQVFETPLSLAADSGTAGIERMGFWNYVARQPYEQTNANEGLDSHLVLRLRGLTPGTVLNKLSLTWAEYGANTVGYSEDKQFLGVYLDGVPQFASSAIAPPAQVFTPVLPANGALNLDLYMDGFKNWVIGPGKVVSLTVETSNGTLTFPNVTL
ncbi:hypothetical protein D3C72_872450 [compost metagenome]